MNRRVRNILTRLKKHVNAHDQGGKTEMLALQQSLRGAEKGLERLFEGVEQGLFDLDETLKTRLQRLKARREEILIQISGIKRRQMLPINTITNTQVDAFCNALKARFNDQDESPRVCRRLNFLRGLGNEDKQKIFPGSPGTGGSYGFRAST